uniref:Venom Lrr domain-containing protein n=1 Tax=Aphidius ervi TaxID=37627 RepID=A0A034WZA0_APHER
MNNYKLIFFFEILFCITILVNARIDCQRGEIFEICQSSGSLKSVRQLINNPTNLTLKNIVSIAETALDDVSPTIFNLTVFGENRDIELPSSMKLWNLRILNFQESFVSLESPAIKELKQLEHLSLGSNTKNLAASKFYRMKTMTLSNSQLDDVTIDLPKYLQELKIIGSTMPAIKANTFTNTKNIYFLTLVNSKICKIDKGAFSGLSKLRFVDLRDNKLEEFPHSIFTDSPKIHYLDISYNNIGEINQFSNNIDYLDYLNLSGNKIKKIKKVFSSLSKLDTLELSNNLIEDIEMDAFKGTKLTTIWLQGNKLKSLKNGIFDSLSNTLENIDLRSNEISYIEDETFFGLRLLNLDLSNNQLKSIQPAIFSGLTIAKLLDLGNNQFNDWKNIMLGNFDSRIIRFSNDLDSNKLFGNLYVLAKGNLKFTRIHVKGSLMIKKFN